MECILFKVMCLVFEFRMLIYWVLYCISFIGLVFYLFGILSQCCFCLQFNLSGSISRILFVYSMFINFICLQYVYFKYCLFLIAYLCYFCIQLLLWLFYYIYLRFYRFILCFLALYFFYLYYLLILSIQAFAPQTYFDIIGLITRQIEVKNICFIF